jgi:hypothetical protein
MSESVTQFKAEGDVDKLVMRKSFCLLNCTRFFPALANVLATWPEADSLR